MTELEEAALTEGQGRALSGHKTAQAYRGYAKETFDRALAATRKRHAHRLANAQSTNVQNDGRIGVQNKDEVAGSSGNEKSWLGRQDSNLGMAESKSEQFSFEINAYSEKNGMFDPLSINRLSAPFGMRLSGNSPVQTHCNPFSKRVARTLRAATRVAGRWRSLKIQSGNKGPLTDGL